MESVNIDFLLNSNVPEEAAKGGDAVDRLADRVLNASTRAKAHLRLQEEVLVAIRGRVREVEAALAHAATPKDTFGLQKQLRETKRELEEQETYVRGVRKEVEKLDRSSLSPFLVRARNLRTEMEALVATGQEGSQRYREVREELRGIAEAQRAVSAEQSALGRGADLSGLLAGLQGIAGAYSAVAGALGLTSGSTEEYARVQTKLQSAIALTVGLQQLQMTFARTRAFRMQAVAGATRLFARAQTLLASSLRISDVAAKALTATLTLGLSLAVTAVATAIDKYVSRQRRAREEAGRLSEAMASSMATPLATFRHLRAEWDTLDDSKREQFVRDSAEAFRTLGVSVSSVSDAERVLVEGEEAMVTSMQHRAMAAALMETASEKYKEGLQKIADADREAGNITVADYLASFGQTVSVEQVSKRRAAKVRREGEALLREGDQLIRQMTEQEQAATKALTDAGLSPYRERAKQQTRVIRQARDTGRLLEEIERDTQAAILAAREEGARERLARLDVEHQGRLRKIATYRSEVRRLETEDPSLDLSRHSAAVDRLSTEEAERYAREREAIAAGSRETLRTIEESITSDLSGELERQLSEANRHYDELARKAHRTALSRTEEETAIARIEEARIRKTEQLRLETDLRRLDRMEQIRIRKAEMESEAEPALLRADREAHVLRVRREEVERRITLLRDLARLGVEVSDALADAALEEEHLSRELREMPTKRMQELGEAVRDICGSLASLPGEVGRTFGTLAKGAEGVMTALDKGATTMERVSSGISGLASVIGMAMETARTNAEAEEAWAKRLESAYHRAAIARIEALSHKPSNLYGVEDPYAKAISGALRYRAAMEELAGTLDRIGAGRVQTGTMRVVSGANVATGIAGGASAGAAIGSIIPGLGTAIGAAIGALFGGITGAAARKTVPVLESISKRYGSIIKEGSRSFELNPAILADYDRLDEVTRKLVDNWEEIRRKGIEAQQEMEESLKSLTGDLGKQLSDALVSGISSGDIDGAMADFGHKMDDLLAGIARQRAFASFFSSYFDTLSREMKASMDAGGDGDIIDDLRRFRASIRERIPEAAHAFEEINKAFGVLHEGAEAERRAVAKRGLAQASQDSIDELMGIETGELLQLRLLVALGESSRRSSEDTARLLSSIAKDVTTIAGNSGHLPRLRAIEEALDLLRRDGITIKQ